ncbi:dimethylarginine dimethylaminohydrolase family protein [Evansella cellulosilytica]|uniref:Amidinotransferase n=1 Tax=Evansella cellulosilytica (strain ATCC 21833 / DSM 2522 / FERM P-1141 / JCM 9156 / N-4) TaxID=649639 RepID=E6U057_EVAC2|nr:dimethylarginine dimethylaminohydrolase family protein [Evansella cellulosilytica]ADU29061.1 amidinotransferase [Evansella cellulosilytica DSM 2522]
MSIKQHLHPTAYCKTEYDTLHRVLLCQPKHMKIRDVINETQKVFKNDGIDNELALKQHNNFIEALTSEGVHVELLPPSHLYPEQVFTRDIGFTLGDTVHVSHMARNVRKGEESILQHWLQKQNMKYKTLSENKIEGGDVLIDGNSIFVGVSHRTNESAIQHLQSLLPAYDVIPIPFNEKYLHLDCVFNIISEREALIYPAAFDKNELELLRSKYDVIEVGELEQFTLGTNVLSLGNKRIISLPINSSINLELNKRGYRIIEVDFSEIIKSGGSFRCCSMPLLRLDE